MRISDWSSDVCSSDLSLSLRGGVAPRGAARIGTSLRLFPWKAGVGLGEKLFAQQNTDANGSEIFNGDAEKGIPQTARADLLRDEPERFRDPLQVRSEEHTSELQSLMRISYAVYCLKKNKNY